MRGLLEKDFRLLRTRKQTLLIFCVLALVMGLSMDASFIIGYLTMLATIVAVGTISYDEFDNGFAFLMTLPFERKTYVREKYLFCLMTAAAAWCAGVAVCCIGNAVRHNAGIPADGWPMLAALIPVMFLSAAVMIPLQLKYGSEKSRIVLFIIFGIIAILIFGANNHFSGSDNPVSGLAETLTRMPSAVVLLVVTAVCALAAFISFLWSVRIIEKKEF